MKAFHHLLLSALRRCYTGQLATTIFRFSWKVDPRVTCHRERFFAQHWVRQNVSFLISFKNTIRCCHENTIRCCAENRCCELTRVTSPLVPHGSIKRTHGLRSGRSISVLRVPNVMRFAVFCTIKLQDQFSKDIYNIL